MGKLTLVNGDPSESMIKEAILTYLWYQKIFCWNNESVGIYDAKHRAYRKKNSRFQLKGVADILGIFSNRFLAIEVKSKEGRLSDDQEAFLNMVSKQGGISFVARSVDDVEKVLFR